MKISKSKIIISSILLAVIGFSLSLLQRKIHFRHRTSYILISFVQAKERYDMQEYQFVDARNDLFYGLGHIKNAVNLPLDKFDKEIINFEKRFPKETGLVIYCDGSVCLSSYTLAKRLSKRGYINIEVFHGGWIEWVDSSFPIER